MSSSKSLRRVRGNPARVSAGVAPETTRGLLVEAIRRGHVVGGDGTEHGSLDAHHQFGGHFVSFTIVRSTQFRVRSPRHGTGSLADQRPASGTLGFSRQ
jgi:hypothetical protein